MLDEKLIIYSEEIAEKVVIFSLDRTTPRNL